MILQFVKIDYLDLEPAKFSVWLMGIGDEPLPADMAELASRSGVSEEALRNNSKIHELLRERSDPKLKIDFRTPLSDWYQIPFLIDRNEKPVGVANAWLRHISRRGSPKTLRTYAYALFDFFQYLESRNIVWQKADDDTLFSYRLHQETTDSSHKKKHKGNRRVLRSTIQMRLLTAGRFYKYATSHGYVEKNPLTYEVIQYRRPIYADFLAHLGRTQEKEIPVAAYSRVSKSGPAKWLSHETIWNWINSIKNERDRLIVKLLYQTGMRREEIILWRVDNIPRAKDVLEDPQRRWVEFSIRGKGGKIRSIRISIKNFLRLRRWMEFDREKIVRRFGIGKEQDHGFVWVSSRDGHPLQAVTLNHIFQRISERCGIVITPHMLRHSFAMRKRADLYEDGVLNPEKVLQAILGHSSVTTTMTIYGHISPQDEAEEAESNADLLAALGSGEDDAA